MAARLATRRVVVSDSGARRGSADLEAELENPRCSQSQSRKSSALPGSPCPAADVDLLRSSLERLSRYRNSPVRRRVKPGEPGEPWQVWRHQGLQALDRDPWAALSIYGSTSRSSSFDTTGDDSVSRNDSSAPVSRASTATHREAPGLSSLALNDTTTDDDRHHEAAVSRLSSGTVSRLSSALQQSPEIAGGEQVVSRLCSLEGPQRSRGPRRAAEDPESNARARIERSSLFIPTVKAEMEVMQHMLHEHGVCVEYNPFANSRENSLDEAAPTAPRRGSVQETLLRRISSVWLA